MYIIYRIFNLINDKSYIGKTHRDFYIRLGEHIKVSNLNKEKPLYRAFNKYGIDSFSAEILAECYTEEQANNSEQFYILFYNSYGKTGYNATFGGEGKKQFLYSDTYVINLYNKHKSVIKVANLLSSSSKTIRNILNYNKVNITDGHSKPVRIIEMNKVFDSVTECAEFLIKSKFTTNKHARSKIYDVLSGSRKSYLKLTFKYL